MATVRMVNPRTREVRYRDESALPFNPGFQIEAAAGSPATATTPPETTDTSDAPTDPGSTEQEPTNV